MYSVTRTVTGGTSNTWRELTPASAPSASPAPQSAQVSGNTCTVSSGLSTRGNPARPPLAAYPGDVPTACRSSATAPCAQASRLSTGASRSCRCYDRRAVPARPPAPPAGHSPKPALRSPRRGTRTKRIPARAAASRTRTTMIRRVQPRSTRHAEGDHLQRADASPSALAGDLNVYCTSCATLTTLTTMSSSAYIHSMRSDFVLSATLAPTNAKGTDATPNTSVIAQLM